MYLPFLYMYVIYKSCGYDNHLLKPFPYPLGTRRCCNVESKSLTLIQRRSNVVFPVGNDNNYHCNLHRQWWLNCHRNKIHVLNKSRSGKNNLKKCCHKNHLSFCSYLDQSNCINFLHIFITRMLLATKDTWPWFYHSCANPKGSIFSLYR